MVQSVAPASSFGGCIGASSQAQRTLPASTHRSLVAGDATTHAQRGRGSHLLVVGVANHHIPLPESSRGKGMRTGRGGSSVTSPT